MHVENKNFKKVFILAIFAIVLCVPIFVFSQGFGLEETAGKGGYDTAPRDVYSMIGNITNAAFATVAFIFFALTVYAGLRWITARGKEDLIEKAKGTMETAIIGLIIVALSYAIASFVINRLSPPAPSTTGGTTQNLATDKECTDKGGFCTAGSCVFGEKPDDSVKCKDAGYVCCVNKEANYSCCICTDNNIGLVATDPKIWMDTGPGGINCSNYCKDKTYPNALSGRYTKEECK